MTRLRRICTKEDPYSQMKTPPGVMWVHPKAHETDADSDYYIEYRCPICNHQWRTEMPD